VSWIVAWRFLRHRRSRLLNGTARAALTATTLGVTAMVIAMALMTGYREDLEAKLLSGNAAVLAYPMGIAREGSEGQEPDAATLDRLASIPGVERVGRVVYGQGSLTVSADTGARPSEVRQVEVTLRGVEPGGGMLSGTAEQLGRGPDGLPGAVLGAELARSLAAEPGDVLRLVVLGFSSSGGSRSSVTPRFRYASVRVTGTFETGFAEFDRSWVAMDRHEVRRLSGGDASEMVEIAATDPRRAPEIVERAQEILGAAYLVTDTRELNRPLFTALRFQQVILFLGLGLIVCVATFNTASTLVVLVRERMRDIGVLATLGVPPAGLRRIFLLYGGLLGTAGTLLGVAVGWSVSWAITEFELIRFDPEVAAIYFLSAVKFRVEPLDLAAVVAFTLGITLVACAIPAWFAARVDPSSALRYE
jgi:lipoprotein-releasing system permease protein